MLVTIFKDRAKNGRSVISTLLCATGWKESNNTFSLFIVGISKDFKGKIFEQYLFGHYYLICTMFNDFYTFAHK